jgi:hypothetical protein
MLDEEEWCIVRYRNEWLHLEPEKRNKMPARELLIRKVYQWEAQGDHYRHKWEYVARGFKSNEEALKYVCLFKE